jgi:hypothetical protein
MSSRYLSGEAALGEVGLSCVAQFLLREIAPRTTPSYVRLVLAVHPSNEVGNQLRTYTFLPAHRTDTSAFDPVTDDKPPGAAVEDVRAAAAELLFCLLVELIEEFV